MAFILAVSVRSVSWLCDSKRSYFESTRSSVTLAVLLLGSTIMSGCIGGDDWDENELDFQFFYEQEYHICYDSEWRIFDCLDFPEDLEHVPSADRGLRIYRWSDYSHQNGDLLKLSLTSHEDSSGMAVVTVTTPDKSDSFKLRSGHTESGIFEMSGTDRYLEVQLEADNGWFGDIVHYTIEVQHDTTYRDTDLDGYIDTVDFCNFSNGTSSISHLGCPDSDGDGWSDTDEYACNTSSGLRNHTPLDLDGDGICNYLDLDDDGDGWEDTEELTCGADSLSPNSIPIVNDRVPNLLQPGECHAILLDSGGPRDSGRELIVAMGIIGIPLVMANRNGRANRRRIQDKDDSLIVCASVSDLAGQGVIGIFRNDVNHAVWVEPKNGQTIGDAVASTGLVGRDGTSWSIQDQSGSDVDKNDPATSFWSQNISVIFQ